MNIYDAVFKAVAMKGFGNVTKGDLVAIICNVGGLDGRVAQQVAGEVYPHVLKKAAEEKTETLADDMFGAVQGFVDRRIREAAAAANNLPQHQWDGPRVRFETAPGVWGPWSINLQGQAGETPDHEWDGTRLRFQTDAGTWGPWVDLVGPSGAEGEPGAEGPRGQRGQRGASTGGIASGPVRTDLDGGNASDGSNLDGGHANDTLIGVPGIDAGNAASTYSRGASTFNAGRAS